MKPTDTTAYTDHRTHIQKSNVIKVDFKNKEKIDDKVVYQWIDAYTRQSHTFDSSREKNVPHVELEFFVGVKGTPCKVNCVFDIDSLRTLKEDIDSVLNEFDKEGE